MGETPGYPRFQGRDRYDSFTYPQGGYSLTADNRVTAFPKSGASKSNSIERYRERSKPVPSNEKGITGTSCLVVRWN